MTEASTIRRELLRRPGVGCKSCQNFCSHEDNIVVEVIFDEGIADEELAAIPLSHDRYGCGPYTEKLRIGILYANADRKPR
jgi:hypothetical protein